MEFLLSTLVVGGALLQLASLFLVHKLIRELPRPYLRTGWKILGIFIIFFFASYLGYLFFLHTQNASLHTIDLLVPFILFFGAVFVLVVNLLSLKTTLDLKRICHLEQENITDPLLGIFNRRYLERRLREEILLSRRDELPLSIMLIDIDRFKEINDTYGHLAGDLVLVNLADLIKQQLRKTDLVARYGGEEILVLLPHTPEGAALHLAEKMRRAVAATVLAPATDSEEGRWPDLKITVSIGVAGLDRETDSEKEFFARADKALYRAKEEGRNRCVAAGAAGTAKYDFQVGSASSLPRADGLTG